MAMRDVLDQGLLMTPTTPTPPSVLPRLRASYGARTGLGVDDLAQALIDNLRLVQGTLPQHATRHDWYMAMAYAVRDRMLDRPLTMEAMVDAHADAKLVAFLSPEFITGPHLENGLINLGIRDSAAEAIFKLGQRLSDLLEEEEEPPLEGGGI